MKKSDENSKVTYCGLCCLDCHGYTGKIPDLARDLRKKLRTYKYDKFAHFIAEQGFGKAFKNYDLCYEVLGAMVKFRCKRGCRNGGGSPYCKIRNCCLKKGFDGCWDCLEFEQCKKLDYLKPVHNDGHIKNLKMIKNNGIKKFMNSKRNW
jgi:hypothetical protein